MNKSHRQHLIDELTRLSRDDFEDVVGEAAGRATVEEHAVAALEAP